MFRSNHPLNLPRTPVNCILMHGGLGDHIASLTAIDYILKNYTWLNLLVWVPDFMLDISKNMLPQGTIVRNYTSMSKHYDQHKTTITTKWEGRHSPMKIHMVDYAFHMLCDEQAPIEKKNYLKVNLTNINIDKFKLPEKYITMATGFTADVREFAPQAVNGVLDYVKSKGYEVVFLGQKNTPTGSKHIIEGKFNEEVRYEEGIDLINDTTLLEAAKIIDGSKAIVGVDCGLMHVAGCTKAPIIGGYTTVSPKMRMPIRNNVLGYDCYPVVPNDSLECSFCQEKTNFLYGHDYKKCIYNDRLCVTQLTADKFIKQLEKVL